MELFPKKIGPVFLKETGDAEIFIERMEKLQEKAEGEVKKEIEKQLKIARYGQQGERNIAFELKNSGMDMYVLHDVFLEQDELSAQIDYIVITRKHTFIIECKNLIGNIEIDNTGAFIRSYELFGKRIKEGIYSPITQNQRHLNVLKAIRKNSKGNFILKTLFEKNFEQNYRSVVVLANPKTCLNARFAPKAIKSQVIRADQLIYYIKEQEAADSDFKRSSEEMRKLAEFFLEKNRPNGSDYAQKYEKIVAEMEKMKTEEKNDVVEEQIENRREDQEEKKDKDNKNKQAEIQQKLKAFRLEQSRKEKVKPYYIFNDAQMKDLIEKNPKNKEELLKVSGFGNVKAEKYGEQIFRILSE